MAPNLAISFKGGPLCRLSHSGFPLDPTIFVHISLGRAGMWLLRDLRDLQRWATRAAGC